MQVHGKQTNRQWHTEHLDLKNSLERWIIETFGVEFSWRERQDLRDMLQDQYETILEREGCEMGTYWIGYDDGYDDGYESGYESGRSKRGG